MAATSAVFKAKQVLRKEVKAKISKLTEEEKRRQSSYVCQKLFSTEHWKESQRISLFLSMKDEIQIREILTAAFQQNKVPFIPRYVGDNMEMLRLYSEDDYNSLPETKWKIKQPADDDNSREMPSPITGGFDLMLIPGLAFTVDGLRMGRGKGYYDSYLKKYKDVFGKMPVSIALAFKEQIFETIPVSDHDVKVDSVLFENEN